MITTHITGYVNVFTKSNAARIFKVSVRKIVKIIEFANCVLVVGKNFCRFVSKFNFFKSFVKFRKEGAKSVDIELIMGDKKINRYIFEAKTNRQDVNDYVVHLQRPEQRVICDCEDYIRNSDKLSRDVPCKHIYAALGTIGYSSLKDFLG